MPTLACLVIPRNLLFHRWPMAASAKLLSHRMTTLQKEVEQFAKDAQGVNSWGFLFPWSHIVLRIVLKRSPMHPASVRTRESTLTYTQ